MNIRMLSISYNGLSIPLNYFQDFQDHQIEEEDVDDITEIYSHNME